MMKASVKGLVIALLAPFVLGQCTGSNEERALEPTEMPQVYDAEAVKIAPRQESVEFYLMAEYPDAIWKVYTTATGTNPATGVSVECDNGTMLMLTGNNDIPSGVYYVTATDPQRAESKRLKLTVSNQAATNTPTAGLPSVAKSAVVQSSVTFIIDNAADYSTAATVKVYVLGSGTQLAEGVTASLFGEILTLYANGTDIAVKDYFIAVTDKDKSESKRLRLSVTDYKPEQTSAPDFENTIVTKTAIEQQRVTFTVRNTYSDTDWKVYAGPTGTATASGVRATLSNGTTLSLSHDLNIPEGVYYVTATDFGEGLDESARVKLTVVKFIPAPTATPEVAVASIAKSAATQTDVVFTLTNDYAYLGTTSCKVYALSSGLTPAIGIIASISGTDLILSREQDIPAGNYYVSVTESNKAESERLKLTITAYEPITPGKTPLPTVAATSVIKTAGIQTTVDFTLTNSAIYENTTWRVYASATGSTVVSGVSASNMDVILTLAHNTDVPEKTYYVTATESGKTESARCALTVVNDITPVPRLTNVTVAKTVDKQPSVNFTLINDDLSEFPNNTTFKLYAAETGNTTFTNINVSLNRTGGSTLLTLTQGSNIQAGDYWLAATVPGKKESRRLNITIIDYLPDRTITPEASVTTGSKHSTPQPTVDFTLTNAANFPAETTWKVYAAPTGTAPASGMSATLNGSVLTLRHGTDVQAKTYYVTATEPNKTESIRLPLSVVVGFMNGQTALPIVPFPIQAKSERTQTLMEFAIDNGAVYSPSATWKVYAAQTGTLEVYQTSAYLLYGTTLVLKHTVNIPVRDYWVAVSELGKNESMRVKLTVDPYAEPKTPTPTTDFPIVEKAALATQQATVVFALTNNPGYTQATTFKVYSTETGNTGVTGITTSFDASTQELTLEHATDVPDRSYWVTATASGGASESERLKLTVAAYGMFITQPPVFSNPCQKTFSPEPDVDIQMTNVVPYSSPVTFKVYAAETGNTGVTGMTTSFNVTAQLLTLSHPTFSNEDYWITATEGGKQESARKKITVGRDIFSTTPVGYRTMVRLAGATITATSGSEIFIPGRQVTLSTFRIAKYETTYMLWSEVYDWAERHGYTFQNPGDEGHGTSATTGLPSGTGTVGTDYQRASRPVTGILWRDAIVWCNAYSEMSGKTPVYTYSGNPIKDSRDANVTACDNAVMDLIKNGYRLPTAAEWEYAARGGDQSDATNWNFTYAGDNIIDNVAWYYGNSAEALGSANHADFGAHPVGTKAANSKGLYDMSGNVRELCWDTTSISTSTPAQVPASGSYRKACGGSWIVDARECSVYSWTRTGASYSLGFRLVLSH